MPLPFSQGISWQSATAAPHRPLFLAGCAQLLLAMTLWFGVLADRTTGLVFPALAVPPAWAHAFLSIYGIFPFFIVGFLLTVFPRWTRQPEVPRARYLSIGGLLLAGMVVVYVGLFSSARLVALGIAVMFAGHVLVLFTLLGIHRRHITPLPRRHEQFLLGAFASGGAGLCAAAYAFAMQSQAAFELARELGLWVFLGLTLFAVAHRMVPFFGQAALQNYPIVSPAGSLPLAAIALVGHASLEVLHQPHWLPVADLPLAVIALQHSWHWDFRRSLSVRLLGMLHIAFAWLGLAMLLYTIRGVSLLAGAEVIAQHAPRHALAIGFVTGMVVAMVSRVTLAHSGRQLWADNLTWYAFLGINVAAVIRIGAEFAPTAISAALNLLATVVWLVVIGAWVAHYAPIYLKPRIDGRPG